MLKLTFFAIILLNQLLIYQINVKTIISNDLIMIFEQISSFMKKLYFFLFSIVSSFFTFGQEVPLLQITGTVESSSGPVVDELLYLFKADSSLYKTELSDNTGKFVFQVEMGNYFMTISNPLFETYKSLLFVVGENMMLQSILLSAKVAEIAQVEVKATKPIIERLPGKMVYNVEQSLQATGSSAWQIIEKSPGVFVTSNDQILVNGKGGAVVHLNGKLLRMSGTDLADYLRAIGSASIEKIEFITNPSASYDANGTVIIDVRMKKDARFGTNGSISANLGMGFYPKAGGNIQINNRNKKWSTFANYGYSYREGFNDLRLNRKFYNKDSLQLEFDQKNYMTLPFQSHLFRTGFDYVVSQKNTLSFQANANQNGFDRKGLNHTNVYDGNRVLTSMFDTYQGGYNKWGNVGSNLTFTHVMDTLGSVWTLDVDYSRFLNNSVQEITTRYFDVNKVQTQNDYDLYGFLNGDLDIYAAKFDLEKNLQKGKLDFGLKSSYVSSDNEVLFFDKSNGFSQLDATKSNHFLYDEWIHASYGNYTQEWQKWSMSGGLRIEQTQIKGLQIVDNQRFDTIYTQAFPTLSVGFTPKEMHHFDLNLSRRIERPSYGQLNPFKFYLDPTTYREGNPYLRPQTTLNMDIAYTFKNNFFFQAGLARTSNNIIEIIAPSAFENNVTVQANINLQHTDLLFFSTSLPFQVNKWWMLRVDGGTYQALYTGEAAMTEISGVGTINGNLQINNQFKIGKNHTIELSGQVQSREVYAFDRIRPRGGLGLSYQMRCLKDKGTLRLNFTDIFYTENIIADVAFRGYDEYFEVRRETRVGTISFAYRFGSMKGANGMRRGGAEELKQRAGGGLG